MSAQRSSCDRCHRMKMQCLTDGGACNRCRSAKTHCNYSKPGRPGRPPTETGSATNQSSGTDKELTRGVNAISPADCPIADDDNWRQNTLPEHAAPKETEYFLEQQPGPWTQYGFVSFSDTAYSQLNATDWPGQIPWSSNITEAEMCASSPRSELRPLRQEITSVLGGAKDPQPQSPMFEATATRLVDQDYMQQLAHFQVTIARMIDCGGHSDPATLEQEAAHVLESSAKFLELIHAFADVAEPPFPPHLPNTSWMSYDCAENHHTGKGPKESSSLNTAVFLQLTSISMRLIELHHWIYSSIYRCFQRDPDTVNTDTAGNCERPPLLFAIAGVRLTPTPFFRLQMLVHAGVYHLGRIQKTLSELEAFRFERTLEESPSLPAQTGMLINEDRVLRMAKIRSVLAKLEEEFGICKFPPL